MNCEAGSTPLSILSYAEATTKVCHRYFSAKFCSMTATGPRVALSSGLRSIRSASELDSRPAPTAQATASPPQLATAAASS